MATFLSLRNTVDLAEWLSITPAELDWFADLKCLASGYVSEQLSHYRFRLLAKRFGSVRLIESPKPRLKAIQRRVLREILDCVSVHDAAHGFRRGRSITSFVAPHVGQAVVARMDLQDFFPSIVRARVAALFRMIGCHDRVARALAGLCTSIAPASVWARHEPFEVPEVIARVHDAKSRYAVPHLPQGAPTSPAIANLCAFRLDSRLAGLARAVGAQYTRYADDLAFSGDRNFARHIKRFLVHVAATVSEEGFRVHHRKTRVMHKGARQHLTGVVVNQRMNIRRSEYDQLKAELTNCQRHGPQSQNRDNCADYRAHLRGRIAFVQQLNAIRGRRMLDLFDRISW